MNDKIQNSIVDVSSDRITVITANRPINKNALPSDKDSGIKTASGGLPATVEAQTRAVPDLEAFKAILTDVSEDENKCFILGYQPDTEPGEVYTLANTRYLAELLKIGYLDVKPGFYEIDGKRYITRTKLNFSPSSWTLLDYDTPPGIPQELLYTSPNEWLEAMNELIPYFSKVGKVLLPSTSSRLTRNGKDNVKIGWHAYVQVNDAADLPRFGNHLLLHSLTTPYGFMRPIYKKGTTEVITERKWSIFDPCVFSPERLVFDGKPKAWLDVEVKPAEITMLPGNRLDTRLIEVTGSQVDKIATKFGGRVTRTDQRDSRGKLWQSFGSINNTDLKFDTKIIVRNGEATLVELLAEMKAKRAKKVRVQAVFRPDSISWAAFVGLHEDGTPFVYDCGTATKYVLNDVEQAKLVGSNCLQADLLEFRIDEKDVEDIKEAEMLYENAIPRGRLVALVGPPGCGKTTVVQYIAANVTDEVFYIHMDASPDDVKGAERRAREGGYHLIAPDYKNGGSAERVRELLEIHSQRDQDLTGTVFVIDTMKKIMTPGNKQDAARMLSVLRKLNAKNATIILLGHTNKYPDEHGWWVYEGVGDVRSDVDCLLLLYPHRTDETSALVSLYGLDQGWDLAKHRFQFRPVTFHIDLGDDRKITLQPEWVDTREICSLGQKVNHELDGLTAIYDFLCCKANGATQTEIVNAMRELPDGLSMSRTKVRRLLTTFERTHWNANKHGANNATLYVAVENAMLPQEKDGV